MKTSILIGAALAALASPAAAQDRGSASPRAEVTRADVEARVRTHFARVDANRDGFVTREEAQALRQRFRAERREARGDRREAVFARLDANADGVISRAEFLDRRASGDLAERREHRAERRADRIERRADRRQGRGFGGQLFQRLDTDRDGRVSLAEATAQRLQAFERADVNRDGRVTPEERRTVREQRRANRG